MRFILPLERINRHSSSNSSGGDSRGSHMIVKGIIIEE